MLLNAPSPASIAVANVAQNLRQRLNDVGSGQALTFNEFWLA